MGKLNAHKYAKEITYKILYVVLDLNFISEAHTSNKFESHIIFFIYFCMYVVFIWREYFIIVFLFLFNKGKKKIGCVALY